MRACSYLRYVLEICERWRMLYKGEKIDDDAEGLYSFTVKLPKIEVNGGRKKWVKLPNWIECD